MCQRAHSGLKFGRNPETVPVRSKLSPWMGLVVCVYTQPRTFGLWTIRTPCGSIRKEQERCNKEATGTGGLRKEGPGVGVSPVKGA